MKEQRGIEMIVDGNIDLAAAAAIGVYNEGAGGAVALREVAVKKVNPAALGGGSASGRMLEDRAGGKVGEHLLL